MKTRILATLLLWCSAVAVAQIPAIDSAPTTADLAKLSMVTAVDSGNAALSTMADSTARSLAVVWQSNEYTPAEALAAMGDKAVAIFQQHAAAVQYLWTDAARRAAFIAALQRHNVAFTISQNGAPVFTAMRPYTAHGDGTITLDD